MKKVLLLLQLFLAFSLFGGEIESGAYELKMKIPDMAEGKQDLALTGNLKAEETKFTFDTKDAMGDPLMMKGKITENGILIWVSDEENGGLVTFHLIGKIDNQDGAIASGDVSIFHNHQRVARGDWKLAKK